MPERLRAAVIRGLSFDARDRWPSMEALVAELHRCLRRRRRFSAFAVVGLAGMVVAALALFARSETAREPTLEATVRPASGLQNPGFEGKQAGESDKPSAWAIDAWSSGNQYEIGLDSSDPRSGSWSLRIRARATTGPEDRSEVSQLLPVNGYRGRFARLSGWLRTKDVGGRGASLFLRLQDSSRGFFYQIRSVEITGDTGWQYYSTDIPIPAPASHLEIGAVLQGTGRAWIDDMDIAPLDVLPSPKRLAAVPIRKGGDLVLSRDGNLLAYSIDGRIQVASLATHEVRTLALPDDTVHAKVSGWFPDGKELMVLRSPRDAPSDRWINGVGELWTLPLEGGHPTRLWRNVSCSAASPNDNEIAVCLDKQVLVVDRKGKTRPVFSSDLRPLHIAWAPDGAHLGILVGTRGSPTLLTVAADGSDLRVIARNNLGLRLGLQRIFGLTWIAGRRLVYPIRLGSGGTVLYAVPIDAHTGEAGRTVGLAYVGDADETALTSSGDGLRLALTANRSGHEIRIVEVGPKASSLVRRIRADLGGRMLGWAEDSKALYFTVSRGNKTELYRKVVGSGDISFMRHMSGRSALAPDRRHLLELVAHDAKCRLALFLSPLGGGPRMRIGTFDLPSEDYPVIKCSTRCLLARKKGGQCVFYSIDLDTGHLRGLPRFNWSPWFEWQPTADANIIAMVIDSRAIRFLNLVSGKAITFRPHHECTYTGLGWGRKDRRLYATCVANPWRGQLVRVKPNGGDDVLLEDSSASFGSVHVAPDGRHVALEAVTYESEAWMFEGL